MKQYSFTLNGKPYEVQIDAIQDGGAEVIVNGTRYQVEMPETPAEEPAGKSPAIPRPNVRHRPLPVRGGTAVESPMPGIILEVCVREGDKVRKGQKVAVLEAMKMENDILSDRDGTVTGIYVNRGDTVAYGVKILTIE